MLVPSGPTASVSPFILQNSQDTRLFWNTLKRGPNSLAVHSPLRNLGADLSLPGPLSLGLLPLRPGLTPSLTLLCQEDGHGAHPPRASLLPGGSRKGQAKGMPRKSPGPELQGAGVQPSPLCSCLLPQGPSSPSVKVGASLVAQPSLIQALALLLSWLSAQWHWSSVLCNLRLPLPASHPTPPHTPLSSPPLPHT